LEATQNLFPFQPGKKKPKSDFREKSKNFHYFTPKSALICPLQTKAENLFTKAAKLKIYFVLGGVKKVP